VPEILAQKGFTIGAVAVAFRGDRGLELRVVGILLLLQVVAVAFRGDRGLEQQCHRELALEVFELRSPFGAIEDWN
jgi:hypothetical protein